METKKLKLVLSTLLPSAPDEQDACINRLLLALENKDGFSKAHLEGVKGSKVLCVHFDPDVISLARVEEIVRAEGAQLEGNFGHSSFKINSPRHIRQTEILKQKIKSIPGVIGVRVGGTGAVTLEFDRNQTSEAKIESKIQQVVGLATTDGDAHANHESHDHQHDDKHDHKPDEAHKHGQTPGEHKHMTFGLGERAELIFSLLSGAMLGIGFSISKWSDLPFSVSLGCYIASYFFGGAFTVVEAIENLKQKRFEIDTLMLVAAIGAAILGEWAEGALLLVLFSFGHALEHYAMGRAKRAIEALAKLAPTTANLLVGSDFKETPVEQIELGNRVLIRPNERVAVDGYIVSGTSSVNQAPVTGESIPVDKSPIKEAVALSEATKIENEHRVFTGTVNGSGALEVIVTKLSTESTLAKIVKLVSEAQADASPTEQFTKRIERYFVPIVLAVAALLPFAFILNGEPFSASLYRAMAVLVAASPCALAISTPSAVLSGIARAGRSGVLVKSGAALENLGRLSAMAFDKTGTLTEGKPVVTDVVALNETPLEELLELAAAVEKTSDHPLAKAVLEFAATKLQSDIPSVSEVQSLTGKGIQAKVAGQLIIVGKPAIFMDQFASALHKPVEDLRSKGRTLIVVATPEKVLGLLGVMDKPRESSAGALASLQSTGLKKLIMLSGDHQKVAESIAKEIGLTDAFGDLMPDDKVKAIKDLRDKYGMVAMVGDGVNDAPAMAASTVGIAMGAAGSDVALETADIALMTDDLNHLVFSVKMSRKASAIIKQNLWVSLGVVAILIPATLFGLGIGPAVAMHEGSTLIVVFNALRLMLYKER